MIEGSVKRRKKNVVENRAFHLISPALRTFRAARQSMDRICAAGRANLRSSLATAECYTYGFYGGQESDRLTKVGAMYGGEGGIRTHGRVPPTLAFEASSFDRSDTSPRHRLANAFDSDNGEGARSCGSFRSGRRNAVNGGQRRNP